MTSAPWLGPEPTLAQLQKQFGWMWAWCGAPCAHSAALPLHLIAARLGDDAPASALRKRPRRTRCGKLGAEIRARLIVGHRLEPLPLNLVPSELKLATRAPHVFRHGRTLH